MAKVIATVDEDTKIAATELYESMGMSLSTAINVFLHQSVNMDGKPFTSSLPLTERRVDWSHANAFRAQIVDGAITADTREYRHEEDVYNNLYDKHTKD